MDPYKKSILAMPALEAFFRMRISDKAAPIADESGNGWSLSLSGGAASAAVPGQIGPHASGGTATKMDGAWALGPPAKTIVTNSASIVYYAKFPVEPGGDDGRFCSLGAAETGDYNEWLGSTRRADNVLSVRANDPTVGTTEALSGSPDTAWHQIAAVRSASSVKHYVDAVEVSSAAGTLAHAEQLTLFHLGLFALVIGTFADIAVFSRAVTPTELASLVSASHRTAAIAARPRIRLGFGLGI